MKDPIDSEKAARLFLAWIERRDDGSLEQFFDLKLPVIYRLAYRLLGNREDAEDVAQQVLVKVMNHRPEASKYLRQIDGWLFKITTNTARDLLRSNHNRTRRERASGEVNSMENHWVNPESATSINMVDNSYEISETREAVNSALSDLPESLREPLVLHYMEELPRDQVAEILKLPESTLRLRLDNGLKKLAVLLSARGITVPSAGIVPILHSLPQPQIPPELFKRLIEAVRHSHTLTAAVESTLATQSHRIALESSRNATFSLAAKVVVVAVLTGAGMAAFFASRHTAVIERDLNQQVPQSTDRGNQATDATKTKQSAVNKTYLQEFALPDSVDSTQCSIAYDGAFLWLMDGLTQAPALLKFDPCDGKMKESLSVQKLNLSGHAIIGCHDGMLWMGSANSISCIDPLKLKLEREFKTQHARGFAIGSGNMFISHPNLLEKLDLSTGKPIATLGSFPSGMTGRFVQNNITYYDGSLWTSINSNPLRIYKLSTDDGRLLSSFQAIEAGSILGLAADGNGKLWLLTSERKIVCISIPEGVKTSK